MEVESAKLVAVVAGSSSSSTSGTAVRVGDREAGLTVSFDAGMPVRSCSRAPAFSADRLWPS